MRKKIVIGLDFDGVVAYNPARVARLPIALFKKHILGVTKVSFFVPRTPLERFFWSLVHESSVFPAYGTGFLKTLVKEVAIEAHLVTGRFGFLEENLKRFLNRWNLRDCFKTITINTNEEQPHLFKELLIKRLHFDYYIEDNWDIVEYLSKKKLATKILWIYNILDRGREYPHKYPYLEKALLDIVKR